MGSIEVIQQKLRELEILAHQSHVSMDFILMATRRQFLYAALERNGGNRCKAAKAMGRHRNTLYRDESTLHVDVHEIKRKARSA